MKNNKIKKEKWKLKMKKILLLIIALIINCFSFLNASYAENKNSANLYSLGYCGNLLKYKGNIVKVAYVVYTKDGTNYPAYCLDETEKGVEDIPYSVSVNNEIKDLELWRYIINGYPYKTIKELGVANKEEAFTATNQAISCYMNKNKIEDYQPIGEAGVRTLNAMKKIINNATNSDEIKVLNTITIKDNVGEWRVDSIDKNYVSKLYNVSAKTNILNYKITIEENSKKLEGIKITDEKNNERNEFKPNEKFKILIPIKELTENGKFNIKVNALINTKTVLYGKSTKQGGEDYALTGKIYEDGEGQLEDRYYKNNTKIVIIKKEQLTGKLMEGAEFQLLDENKNVLYDNLRTGKDGKIIIENIIPGRYYLKETKTIEGYTLLRDLVNINLDFNQQATVTVNNGKELKPLPGGKHIPKNNTTENVEKEEVKKLPVTGM